MIRNLTDADCLDDLESETGRVEALKRYNYIRLVTPDINGIHLSKLISTRNGQRIVQGQCEMYSGIMTVGPRMEPVDIPEVVEKKHSNSYLIPDFKTLHPCPWAGCQNRADFRPDSELVPGHQIGAVLCDLYWPSGEPMQSHPRVLLKHLLTELERNHQLKLMSAFEPEFRVFTLESVEPSCINPKHDAAAAPEPIPFTRGIDMYKTSLLAVYESFLMTVDQYMSKAGIHIQDFLNENGAGQLECPMLPEFGIAAADNYFIMKQALKEIGVRHGMGISFMTTPLKATSSSGCHFNHSLWHVQSGRNAFHDEKDPLKLSKLARYWLGGLLEHLPAMLALCSPTINCYRRLHKKWAPDATNWDIDDRFVTIRVKNVDEKRTFIENRMSSSASNPYLVMATTIVAGMDGLERQLEPPSQGQKPEHHDASCQLLPHSLSEALRCLKADQVFVEKLSPYFVDCYIRNKEQGEFSSLSDLDGEGDDDLKLAYERYEYLQFM